MYLWWHIIPSTILVWLRKILFMDMPLTLLKYIAMVEQVKVETKHVIQTAEKSV